MGNFTDGLKAGFMGGFGVDYYAKKSADTLAEIRDQNAYGYVGADAPAVLDPAQWFEMALPLMADIDQCLAWTRWVILYKQNEIEAALDRLIAATSGWKTFTEAALYPSEVLSMMVKYGAAVGLWQKTAEEWLRSRDTDALVTKFEFQNQRWTALDDELRSGLR